MLASHVAASEHQQLRKNANPVGPDFKTRFWTVIYLALSAMDCQNPGWKAGVLVHVSHARSSHLWALVASALLPPTNSQVLVWLRQQIVNYTAITITTTTSNTPTPTPTTTTTTTTPTTTNTVTTTSSLLHRHLASNRLQRLCMLRGDDHRVDLLGFHGAILLAHVPWRRISDSFWIYAAHQDDPRDSYIPTSYQWQFQSMEWYSTFILKS